MLNVHPAQETNELGENVSLSRFIVGRVWGAKSGEFPIVTFNLSLAVCVCVWVFNIFSFVPTIVLCILFCFSSPRSHSISIFHDNRVTGNKLCTFIEHSNNNGEAVWGNVSCWKWRKYIKLLQVATGTEKVTKLDKLRKDSNELDQLGLRWFFNRICLISDASGDFDSSKFVFKVERKNPKTLSL